MQLAFSALPELALLTLNRLYQDLLHLLDVRFSTRNTNFSMCTFCDMAPVRGMADSVETR